MRHRRFVPIAGALAAISLVAAACGDDDEPTAEDEDTTTTAEERGGELTIEVLDTVSVAVGEDSTDAIEPQAGTDRGNVNGALSIGSVLPSSGDLAVLGEPMNEAVAMAVEDINAAGGVFDQDVTLDARDSGTNEQVASDAVDALLSSDADAIIGPASSRVSLSVIDKITGAGVTQCSPSNTGLDFTTYEDGGYYFRTSPPDNLQARVMADELIIPDGHETIGIIALADSYGQGFASSLQEQLEDAGVEVVVSQAYDPNGTNFDSDVQALVDADADAYVVWGFPDTGAIILSGMVEAGIGPADKPVYTGDGLQSSSLGEAVDPNNPGILAGMKGTAPSAAPPDGEPTFGDRFAEFAPGVDTIFSAHAYDCAIILALAAISADSDASSDIAANMQSVTKDGEKCAVFAECKELLEAGEDIDYDGASGGLDFVNAGEPGAGAYDIWEFRVS